METTAPSKTITSLKELNPDGLYTYAEYLLWQFQERVELLRGRLFPMSAPSVKHQATSSNLQGTLWAYLQDKTCQVFAAPFDVRLTRASDDAAVTTVVQPDLCIICDDSKLDERGCAGAPTLVVEILSPSNSKREMRDKFELYEEAGVPEYWVIDPEHRLIFIYRLNAKSQAFEAILPVLTDEDKLTSPQFPGLEVEVIAVFGKE